MRKQDVTESRTMRVIVAMCDMLVLALCLFYSYGAIYLVFPDKVAHMNLHNYMLLAVLCYVPIAVYMPPLFLRRVVRGDHIVERCFLTALAYIAFFVVVLFLMKGATISRMFVSAFFVLFSLGLSIEHMCLRGLVKTKRSTGGNQNHVILIGAVDELQDLYQSLQKREYGLVVDGIFTDDNIEQTPSGVSRLGSVAEALGYLQEHPHIDSVYCSMASMRKSQMLELYRHCENSVTRFFALPIYVNFLRRNMVVSSIGSTIMLSSRPEPLRDLGNRIVKRVFDVLFSGLFLLTIFPIIYVFVAIIIKRQSPGPVFFFQKRSGLNGKEFECIKFRSMYLNDAADKIQATEDDPRKFRFGDFMRRTNIDELPQFINVLKGDMSIVGPRPHMLSHTESYRQLVNRYMVRHWVKPGITGWAQIQGFRGEIKELSQLEDRVHADIWYVENWSFWLDIRIIYRTILNMLLHKEENAY